VLAAGRRAAREGKQGRRRREEGKEGKRKRKKGKRKGRKERKGRKRKMGRKIKKRGGKIGEGILEKSGRLSGKIRKGFVGFFPGFSGVGALSGTAVMARRTGHRDRGVCGIPGRWPTATLGRCAGVRPGCGAGGNRGTRVGERERERERERENSG
jgi:hypothetical protein